MSTVVEASQARDEKIYAVQKKSRSGAVYTTFRLSSLKPQKRIKEKTSSTKCTKIRSSITPGTVLIILAGKYRGARVVFLKQLSSGLLLASGPASINQVPLIRINQVYVIATSTKIDISSVVIPDEIDDALFRKNLLKSVHSEDSFFNDKKNESDSNQAIVQYQELVDKALETPISAVPLLKEYLTSKFTVRSGAPPHALKF